MENIFIIYIAIGIIFFATTIGGRIVSERGLKTLTDEQRGKLLNDFSKFRIYNLAALLGLIMIYVGFNYYQASLDVPILKMDVTLLYFILLGIYIVVTNVISFLKLKGADVTPEYKKSVYVATGLKVFGLLIVMAGVFMAFSQA